MVVNHPAISWWSLGGRFTHKYSHVDEDAIPHPYVDKDVDEDHNEVFHVFSNALTYFYPNSHTHVDSNQNPDVESHKNSYMESYASGPQRHPDLDTDLDSD